MLSTFFRQAFTDQIQATSKAMKKLAEPQFQAIASELNTNCADIFTPIKNAGGQTKIGWDKQAQQLYIRIKPLPNDKLRRIYLSPNQAHDIRQSINSAFQEKDYRQSGRIPPQTPDTPSPRNLRPARSSNTISNQVDDSASNNNPLPEYLDPTSPHHRMAKRKYDSASMIVHFDRSSDDSASDLSQLLTELETKKIKNIPSPEHLNPSSPNPRTADYNSNTESIIVNHRKSHRKSIKNNRQHPLANQNEQQLDEQLRLRDKELEKRIEALKAALPQTPILSNKPKLAFKIENPNHNTIKSLPKKTHSTAQSESILRTQHNTLMLLLWQHKQITPKALNNAADILWRSFSPAQKDSIRNFDSHRNIFNVFPLFRQEIQGTSQELKILDLLVQALRQKSNGLTIYKN